MAYDEVRDTDHGVGLPNIYRSLLAQFQKVYLQARQDLHHAEHEQTP